MGNDKIRAPEGYLTAMAFGPDTCIGCAFATKEAECPKAPNGLAACTEMALEMKMPVIFIKAPVSGETPILFGPVQFPKAVPVPGQGRQSDNTGPATVPKRANMHNLRHKALLQAFKELVQDFEAHCPNLPVNIALVQIWAEGEARITAHDSLHPGIP